MVKKLKEGKAHDFPVSELTRPVKKPIKFRLIRKLFFISKASCGNNNMPKAITLLNQINSFIFFSEEKFIRAKTKNIGKKKIAEAASSWREIPKIRATQGR